MRNSLAIAALAAIVSILPAAAQAATECKDAVAATAFSDTDAWHVWSQTVASQYGPEWADLGLARGKTSSQLNLALAVTYLVSAQPCRTVRIGAGLLGNVGDLNMLQDDPDEPSGPANALKAHKNFARFN